MRLDFTKTEYEQIIQNAGFTDFELEVLGFLRRGWFYEDIATELNCCKDKIGRTARSVKKKIMKVG